MKQSRASSLIVVLLAIAGVITVTVGAQRLVLVQFAQSNQETDNVFAYNAAKAGIEDGLVRFRYNRNVQTTTTPKALVYRYDLTTGTAAAGGNGEVDPASDLPGSSSDEIYDLAINFKSQQIGMNADGSPAFNATNAVAVDDFVQLTGFAQSAQPYFLRYAFNFVDPITGAACTNSAAFAQLQVTYFNPANNSTTLTNVTTPAGQYLYDSSTAIANIQVNPGAQLIKSVRIRPFYCSAQFAFNTSLSSTADGKGVGADAGPVFDNLTTAITATGYYGAAKRTLLATVNRQTGALINIYDFTAYAGSGSVSP